MLQAHGPTGHTETWGAQVHGARWAGLLRSGRVSAAGHLPLDLPALLSCQDGPCAVHSDPAPLPRLGTESGYVGRRRRQEERVRRDLGATWERKEGGGEPFLCAAFHVDKPQPAQGRGCALQGGRPQGPESMPAKDSPSSPPLALRSCHPSLAPRTPPSPVPSRLHAPGHGFSATL